MPQSSGMSFDRAEVGAGQGPTRQRRAAKPRTLDGRPRRTTLDLPGRLRPASQDRLVPQRDVTRGGICDNVEMGAMADERVLTDAVMLGVV
jgi:hypothetical protein